MRFKRSDVILLILVVIIWAIGIYIIVGVRHDNQCDQAIIRLDGEVYYDVDVKSWRRINNNEVEIIGTNGTVYRTHMNNVLLLGGGEK